MRKQSLISACSTGLFALALCSAAAATPPPNASSIIPICGYVIDLNLSFGQTGTTAQVSADADLQPDGFSPPAPLPVNYTVYASGSWRDSLHPSWDVNEDSRSGSASFPATSAHAGQLVFKDAGCQLKGVATVVVTCASGPPQVRTLERTWNGCGI